MTAQTQIAFCQVGDTGTGCPVEAMMVHELYAAQMFTPTSSNQQTTSTNVPAGTANGACPKNIRFARVETNTAIMVSFGPATSNNGAGPNANSDPGATYIPSGSPPQFFAVQAGDLGAVILAPNG
jgi:hypothetical protein